MNTLQIEDVFEPYYVGRKPFLAPKPVAQRDADRTKREKEADAKSDSSAARTEATTNH